MLTTVRRLLHDAPPAAGAIVMGTSIVSIALFNTRAHGLSDVLMWIAVAFWIGLAIAYTDRALHERGRLEAEAMQPAALTAAADSCVLGTRLVDEGWQWPGYALLVLGALAWAPLTVDVLLHREPHPAGAGFLLTVATESLAILAIVLGPAWLQWVGLVLVVLGLVLYALVLSRFEMRELVRDFGDHWVAGGGLAISALALAALAAAPAPAVTGVASTAGLVVWIAAVAWLPPLVVCEILQPRLHYDVRRWATVFPLGMYAVASIALGRLRGLGWMVTFGHVFTWIALAVWALTLVGMLLGARGVVRTMT